MAKAQRTLREFTTPDSIFVDFPSLSDFDDTYICDTCIDTHLCYVCGEIKYSFQGDTNSSTVTPSLYCFCR